MGLQSKSKRQHQYKAKNGGGLASPENISKSSSMEEWGKKGIAEQSNLSPNFKEKDGWQAIP